MSSSHQREMAEVAALLCRLSWAPEFGTAREAKDSTEDTVWAGDMRPEVPSLIHSVNID
jgi:hypothetical protein